MVPPRPARPSSRRPRVCTRRGRLAGPRSAVEGTGAIFRGDTRPQSTGGHRQMQPCGWGEPRPYLSVCIVTGRRIPLLDACLASLQDQVDPPTFELLVCSDGDDDVAAAVHARFPDAGVCQVDRALPGAGRNLLVEQAQGSLL